MEKNVVTIDIDTPPKAGANKAIKANANKIKLGFSARTDEVVTNKWTKMGDIRDKPNGTADTTANEGNGAIAIPIIANNKFSTNCIQLEYINLFCRSMEVHSGE